ncbi:MAG: hypothetical protein U0X75_17800 [Acidobacteriota bacterium]
MRVIEGIKDRYESYHNVRYTAEAIEAAVFSIESLFAGSLFAG